MSDLNINADLQTVLSIIGGLASMAAIIKFLVWLIAKNHKLICVLTFSPIRVYFEEIPHLNSYNFYDFIEDKNYTEKAKKLEDFYKPLYNAARSMEHYEVYVSGYIENSGSHAVKNLKIVFPSSYDVLITNGNKKDFYKEVTSLDLGSLSHGEKIDIKAWSRLSSNKKIAISHESGKVKIKSQIIAEGWVSYIAKAKIPLEGMFIGGLAMTVVLILIALKP